MRSHVDVSLFLIVLCVLGGVNYRLVVDVQDGRGHVASVWGYRLHNAADKCKVFCCVSRRWIVLRDLVVVIFTQEHVYCVK